MSSNSIQFIYHNVTSLTNDSPNLNKPSAIFNEYKFKDLFAITETWKNLVQTNTLISSFAPNLSNSFLSTNHNTPSRGILICWNEKKISLTHSSIDENGRYICCSFNHLDTNNNFTFIAIYAPDRHHTIQERADFFNNLINIIPSNQQNIVLCGDFNLDPDSITNNSPLSLSFLSLCDRFKLQNAYTLPYKLSTFFSSSSNTSIDHTFISQSLAQCTSPTSAYKFIGTTPHGHIPLTNTITFSDPIVKPKTFRFNPTLLQDEHFTMYMTDIINNCAPHINTTKDWIFFKELLSDHIGKYQEDKRKQSFKLRSAVNYTLLFLSNTFAINQSEHNSVALQNTREKYFRLEAEYHAQTYIQHRTKADHDREVPSAKTTNFIHKSLASKNIITLTTTDGRTLTETKDITHEIHQNFQNIYKKNPTNKSIFHKLKKFQHLSISDQTKQQLDQAININELKCALPRLKNNKSPGPDGLTSEFYKQFNDLLIPILHRVFNDFISNPEDDDHADFNFGFITCIPKKVVHITHFNHIRPISLCNNDYKLLSHILNNRISTFISNIIPHDQCGYISKRNLIDNIQKINNIFETTDISDACIPLLDFNKAFDSIDHDFITDALSTFNFGDRFISYLQALWHNASSSILINGVPSPPFRIETGVRQGDPIAGTLFIIAIEIFANCIRNNQKISWVSNIYGSKIVISLYCDDIILFLKGHLSVKTFSKYLKIFCDCSGMSINVTKSFVTNNTSFNLPYTILDHQSSTTLLGFSINNNGFLKQEPNRIKKMSQVIDKISVMWLSLLGKKLIIQAYCFSQLTFFTPIVDFHDQYNTINQYINKALWNQERTSKNGKTFFNAKIATSRLIQPKSFGGIGLIDIETHHQAIKSSFICKWLNNHPQYSFINDVIDSCNSFKIPWLSLNFSKSINDAFKYIQPFIRTSFDLSVFNSIVKINCKLRITQAYIIQSIQDSFIHATPTKQSFIKNIFVTLPHLTIKINNFVNFLPAIYSSNDNNLTISLRPLNSCEWIKITNIEIPKQQYTFNTNNNINIHSFHPTPFLFIHNPKTTILTKSLTVKQIYTLLLLQYKFHPVSRSLITKYGSDKKFFETSHTALNIPFRNKVREFYYLYTNSCLFKCTKFLCPFCTLNLTNEHLFSSCRPIQNILKPHDTTFQPIVYFSIWKVYNNVRNHPNQSLHPDFLQSLYDSYFKVEMSRFNLLKLFPHIFESPHLDSSSIESLISHPSSFFC
jgi:endonuclease/exonuclease/phosphatase family metal-dependent hydrolase